MKRGSATSGSNEHVALVKLATKRIVDRFMNLHNINISYESHAFSFEIRFPEKQGYYRPQAFLEFRPDILVEAEHKGLRRSSTLDWEGIFDSKTCIFECETDPRNIFGNRMKCESYKRIKTKNRQAYAFILVVWDDANVPKNHEPFDEVWRFKKDDAP